MTHFYMPEGTCQVWSTPNYNVGFHIQDDLREWLENNAIDFKISYAAEEISRWEMLWRPVIVFSNDDHAMLFKLTWL